MSVVNLEPMTSDNGTKNNIIHINTYGASYQDVLNEIQDLKIALNIAVSNKFNKIVFSDNSELYADGTSLKFKDSTGSIKTVTIS